MTERIIIRGDRARVMNLSLPLFIWRSTAWWTVDEQVVDCASSGAYLPAFCAALPQIDRETIQQRCVACSERACMHDAIKERKKESGTQREIACVI